MPRETRRASRRRTTRRRKIRAKYDYSGGVDGSEYIKLGTGASPAKADTSWLDKLGESSYNYDQSGQISAKLDALLNRTPFSYDAASDPLYQQYRKQYTREADRSAEDVLGKAAVMTGGMPSTAAVAASQQASDYQMSQMTDKIPELQQLAYSMYQDGLNADRADLNTLIGLEDNNYNRWLADRNYLYQLARDQVGDQQAADALAYQKQQDKLNYDYQKERDAIEDARYNAEWQYKLQQAAQQAAAKTSGRSGGDTRRSGGNDGGNESSMKLSTAKDMAKQGIFSAEVRQAFYDAGYNDEYLKNAYGYNPNHAWMYDGGYNGAYFNAAMSSLRTMLEQGKTDNAIGGIKSFWDKLSNEQKQKVRALVESYGGSISG